ncbi:MAG TPA: tetratricopeptide repeat protein [Bacteroidales bacterium]
MKKYIIFFSLLAYMVNAQAVDPKTQIKEAEGFYTKGDFSNAIDRYRSVLNAGYISEELYYNLGNAYFKMHDIKSAILYYEKAKLLDPSDKDVEYNLELAKSYTVDKIESMNEVFFVTWIKWVRDMMSASKWAWLSLIAFFLALGAFLLYLLSGKLVLRKIGFTAGVVIFILSLVSFSMGYQLRHAQTANNTAIIFTPTVTVRSTPAESGNSLFVLHEGVKVDILAEMSDLNKVEWCEIRIADGNRGWIKKTDLERI